MATTTEVNVKGMKELGEALQGLPDKLQRNVMRAALRAGAKEIEQAAKSSAPVGAPSDEGRRLYGHYSGALRDSIRVSTRVSRGVVTSKVVAGGKTKRGADVFYAHMVEFGTAAHVIQAKQGSYLSFGGHRYRQVMHPGTRPQPFMRPAFDGQAQAAIRAVAEKVRGVLSTKHGIDVAPPLEDGDE